MVNRSFFHLHLISDSTGETLIAVARAAAAQYEGISAIEHVYPLVRSRGQLERVIAGIQAAPGMVLYTLVDSELAGEVERAALETGSPCLSVLSPVMQMFDAYLGTSSRGRPGAQHTLDADYFRRIDAMNYTLMHDDGQCVSGLSDADVILFGVSRTSKTPTSIYLANRGIKTANIPYVAGAPLPEAFLNVKGPLVVGLVASAERIVQIRQNRLLSLNAADASSYVDEAAVAAEITDTRRICARNRWPVIDVTRRSIEETAAAILDLYREHKQRQTQAWDNQ
ncbi:pyruvate, water dikinase regulatory protein [Camelimonas abortus]|uniref:Putative pyruvate, phosphate dikinase regulatory protein n=1 Tax=Camelimonas abortus TaxID=1017184 RepID=A0ABV7LCY2_9HYPH